VLLGRERLPEDATFNEFGSSLSGVGSPARKGCADLFDRAAD
jgi:hypothetical protein